MIKSRCLKELGETKRESIELMKNLDCLRVLFNSNNSFIYIDNPAMIFSPTTNGVEIYSIHNDGVKHSISDIFENISPSDQKKIVYNLHLFV